MLSPSPPSSKLYITDMPRASKAKSATPKPASSPVAAKPKANGSSVASAVASTSTSTLVSPPQDVPDLIDSHVSSQQAAKALSALATFVERKRNESAGGGVSGNATLLPMDRDEARSRADTMWLQLTIKKLHTQKMVKPIRIPLAHSLSAPTASVCLLVKDPQREYKDLLTEQGIRSVSRVVGVKKLKGKFRPFDARRQLLADHDLFLADDRIIPILPKLLGSKWFAAKKQPVPVRLTRKGAVKAEIESAISSTYYTQNKGTCTSVKIGSLALHTPQELLENLSAALPSIVARVPGKWANVQALDIKTGNSVALPVWNCKLGSAVESEEGRWEGLDARVDSEAEVSEEDDANDVEDEDDEDEQPKTLSAAKAKVLKAKVTAVAKPSKKPPPKAAAADGKKRSSVSDTLKAKSKVGAPAAAKAKVTKAKTAKA